MLASRFTLAPKGIRHARTPARALRPASVLVRAQQANEYVVGGKTVTMPLGAVQQLPEPLQAAAFAGIYAALAAGTYASATFIAPAIAEALPGLSSSFEAGRAPVLGALFAAAGVAHFTQHDAFTSMYPKPGAWGFWYLPGSASFHVNWTGVAEVLGGGALALTGLVPPLAAALPGLQPAAAAGLLALTAAVTPANIYMFTHNAPGPVPEALPAAGHLFRGAMQVFLLTCFLQMATP